MNIDRDNLTHIFESARENLTLEEYSKETLKGSDISYGLHSLYKKATLKVYFDFQEPQDYVIDSDLVYANSKLYGGYINSDFIKHLGSDFNKRISEDFKTYQYNKEKRKIFVSEIDKLEQLFIAV
jgi:hypothetical protein